MALSDNPLQLIKSLTGGALLGAGLLGLLQVQHIVPWIDLNQAMTLGALIGSAIHRIIDGFLTPITKPIRYYSQILELRMQVHLGIISVKQAKFIQDRLVERYFLGIQTLPQKKNSKDGS